MGRRNNIRGCSTVFHLGSNWVSRPKAPPDPKAIFKKENAEDERKKWLGKTSPEKMRRDEEKRQKRIEENRELLAKSDASGGAKNAGRSRMKDVVVVRKPLG